MSEGWRWDETLYRGSAACYSVGRLPYPPVVAGVLDRALELDGTGRGRAASGRLLSPSDRSTVRDRSGDVRGIPIITVAVAGFLTGGAAHGAKNVLMRTLIHELVPEHRRGRAYAAYNALRNATEMLALAAGGTLVTLVGARLSLLLAGIGPMVVAALTLPVLSRHRARARGHSELGAAVTVGES